MPRCLPYDRVVVPLKKKSQKRNGVYYGRRPKRIHPLISEDFIFSIVEDHTRIPHILLIANYGGPSPGHIGQARVMEWYLLWHFRFMSMKGIAEMYSVQPTAVQNALRRFDESPLSEIIETIKILIGNKVEYYR